MPDYDTCKTAKKLHNLFKSGLYSLDVRGTFVDTRRKFLLEAWDESYKKKSPAINPCLHINFTLNVKELLLTYSAFLWLWWRPALQQIMRSHMLCMPFKFKANIKRKPQFSDSSRNSNDAFMTKSQLRDNKKKNVAQFSNSVLMTRRTKNSLKK